jgi:hypothetical protein
VLRFELGKRFGATVTGIDVEDQNPGNRAGRYADVRV